MLRGAFIPVRIPSGLVAANRSHQVPQVISHGLGSVLWDLGFGVLGLGPQVWGPFWGFPGVPPTPPEKPQFSRNMLIRSVCFGCPSKTDSQPFRKPTRQLASQTGLVRVREFVRYVRCVGSLGPIGFVRSMGSWDSRGPFVRFVGAVASVKFVGRVGPVAPVAPVEFKMICDACVVRGVRGRRGKGKEGREREERKGRRGGTEIKVRKKRKDRNEREASNGRNKRKAKEDKVHRGAYGIRALGLAACWVREVPKGYGAHAAHKGL